MPTVVVNVRDQPFEVYIGRPSKWSNPFWIDWDGSRQEVVQKYRKWIETQPELKAEVRKELRGKVLGCWCKPLPCHGDVLAEVADGD